jgi:TolB protein
MRVFYAVLTLLMASVLLVFGSSNPVISQAAITNTQPSQAREWITFISDREGDPAIYVMQPDGNNVHRLTDTNSSLPVWSSDGKKIAFVSWRDTYLQIYVMNPDGTDQKNLSHSRTNDRRPRWTPDGKQIVFDSVLDEFAYPQIYIMDADGSNKKQLSGNQLRGSRSPAISPDGKQIAFSSEDGGHAIYIMNIDGSHIVKMSEGKSDPVWSPDGKFIASSDYRSISITEVATGKTTELINSKFGQWPSWSPDGKQIVYTQINPDEGTTVQLYTINTDGSNPVNISHNNYIDALPSWSPVPITINSFPVERTPISTRAIPPTQADVQGQQTAVQLNLFAQATEILGTVTAEAQIGTGNPMNDLPILLNDEQITGTAVMVTLYAQATMILATVTADAKTKVAPLPATQTAVQATLFSQATSIIATVTELAKTPGNNR